MNCRSWSRWSAGPMRSCLIARILTHERLSSLLSLCRKTGLSALTEVHDREDLQKAMDCGADIIGINNRDLDTFHVDLETTRKLAPFVPDHCLLVCESGIRCGDTIRSLSGLANQRLSGGISHYGKPLHVGDVARVGGSGGKKRWSRLRSAASPVSRMRPWSFQTGWKSWGSSSPQAKEGSPPKRHGKLSAGSLPLYEPSVFSSMRPRKS